MTMPKPVTAFKQPCSMSKQTEREMEELCRGLGEWEEDQDSKQTELDHKARLEQECNHQGRSSGYLVKLDSWWPSTAL